jgi:hypothetical protein
LSPPRAAAQLFLAAGCIALAACADRAEPARRALIDAQGTVATVSADAARYAPEDLAAAERAASGLRKAYEDKDFEAVLARAPAVIEAAHAAAAAAARRKEEINRVESAEWVRLSERVPALLGELRARSGPRADPAADRAQAGQRAVSSLWSKAVAAFAAGNLEEAAKTGRAAETEAQALAQTAR